MSRTMAPRDWASLADTSRPDSAAPLFASMKALLLHLGTKPVVAAIVAMGACLYFTRAIVFPRWSTTDHAAHLRFAASLIHDGTWLPHFLYHFVVALLSGWSGVTDALERSAIVVLTLAVLAKWRLTVRWCEAGGRHREAAPLVALGLAVAMPVFNGWNFPNVYLGQMAPNVWHNPTTIFTMPIVFLLFDRACSALERGTLRAAATASLWMILNVVAKPNFVLAFGPVLGLAWVCHRPGSPRAAEWGAWLIRGLVLFVPVAMVMGLQFRATYAGGAETVVAWDPLAVWRLYSPNIPATIGLSLAFPACVAILYHDVLRRDGRLRLAWLTMVVAAAQLACLSERGPRFFHANFFWGAHFATAIVFAASAAALLRQPVSRRTTVCWIVLGMHVAAGVVYYVWLLFGRGHC